MNEILWAISDMNEALSHMNEWGPILVNEAYRKWVPSKINECCFVLLTRGCGRWARGKQRGLRPAAAAGVGPEFHGFCSFPSGNLWAGLFFPLFFFVFEIGHLLVLKSDFSFHRNLKSDIMKYVWFQISDRGDVRSHKKGKNTQKKHSTTTIQSEKHQKKTGGGKVRLQWRAAAAGLKPLPRARPQRGLQLPRARIFSRTLRFMSLAPPVHPSQSYPSHIWVSPVRRELARRIKVTFTTMWTDRIRTYREASVLTTWQQWFKYLNILEI